MRQETLDLINIYRRSPAGEYRVAISSALDYLLSIERDEYKERMAAVDTNLEIWKDVSGYKGMYQISNFGRLKSLSRKWAINEKILFGTLQKLGYIKICLRKNNDYNILFAHVVVANAFIPKVNGKKFINHINGDKTDNRVQNLERCTNSENQRHAFVFSKNVKNVMKGEECPYAKNNNKIILEIRELLDDGVQGKEIASRYGLSSSMISFIKNKRRWSHL